MIRPLLSWLDQSQLLGARVPGSCLRSSLWPHAEQVCCRFCMPNRPKVLCGLTLVIFMGSPHSGHGSFAGAGFFSCSSSTATRSSKALTCFGSAETVFQIGI